MPQGLGNKAWPWGLVWGPGCDQKGQPVQMLS